MRINIMNKHYEDAILLWTYLAKQGDANAQFNLGHMYGEGHGVIKNIVVAYAWLNVSAAQGNETARKYRDSIQKEIPPSQLLKALELSKVYCEKYAK